MAALWKRSYQEDVIAIKVKDDGGSSGDGTLGGRFWNKSGRDVG